MLTRRRWRTASCENKSRTGSWRGSTWNKLLAKACHRFPALTIRSFVSYINGDYASFCPRSCMLASRVARRGGVRVWAGAFRGFITVVLWGFSHHRQKKHTTRSNNFFRQELSGQSELTVTSSVIHGKADIFYHPKKDVYAYKCKFSHNSATMVPTNADIFFYGFDRIDNNLSEITYSCFISISINHESSSSATWSWHVALMGAFTLP